MSGLDVFQWIFNFASMAAIAICFFRLKRPPKDDPRLSKGLQLLQSKISVLEDLSDRTEVQVAQMTKLLELKAGQVQKKVQQAELQIRKIEIAMVKSKEVAEIFQDKIPHDEIVERKNTIKYVQAARLAHQGASVEEIAQELNIPKAEAEFIAKVNKDQLMFDENLLPEWANASASESVSEAPSDFDSEGETEDWLMDEPKSTSTPQAHTRSQRSAAAAADFSRAFIAAEDDSAESLKKLGSQFREAVQDFEDTQMSPETDSSLPMKGVKELGETSSQLFQSATEATKKMVDRATDILQSSLNEVSEKALEAKSSQKQPSAAPKVSVTPSDYRRNYLSDFRGEQKQIDSQEILKVQFPNIDVNDQLE